MGHPVAECSLCTRVYFGDDRIIGTHDFTEITHSPIETINITADAYEGHISFTKIQVLYVRDLPPDTVFDPLPSDKWKKREFPIPSWTNDRIEEFELLRSILKGISTLNQGSNFLENLQKIIENVSTLMKSCLADGRESFLSFLENQIRLMLPERLHDLQGICAVAWRNFDRISDSGQLGPDDPKHWAIRDACMEAAKGIRKVERYQFDDTCSRVLAEWNANGFCFDFSNGH